MKSSRLDLTDKVGMVGGAALIARNKFGAIYGQCFILNEELYSFGQKGIYRDMEYAKSECENLAEQASKFSKATIRYNKISQII